MKYTDYKLDDFLKDDYFIQWVTNGQNESNHFWDNWICNHPGKSNIVSEAKQLILAFNYKQSFKLEEKKYTDLLEGILKNEIVESGKISKTKWLKNQNYFNWIGWVAAMLIVSFGVYWITAVKEGSLVSQNAIPSYIHKHTSRGQKISMKLKDGTVVKLNSNSKLRFPESFSKTERVVYLEGEAFFDVAKDELRPFRVVTGDITTMALGTSFNVMSSYNEENVKVALVTGVVEVKDGKGSAIILTPNEMVIYQNGKIDKRIFDYNKEVAWSDGKLYFNEESLDKVFKRLEDWYDFDFEFDLNTPIKGKYNGEFANNPSLERVLNGISYASNFKYKIVENKILIKN
jgi:transmembrane sensor